MLHHMARCGGLCKIVATEIIIRKPAPAGNLAALRERGRFPHRDRRDPGCRFAA
jgi:hypothetical protein